MDRRMDMVEGLTRVEILEDPEEYAARAGRLADEADETAPLPVLASPALDWSRQGVQATRGPRLPGTVLVVDGDPFACAGRLLALRTGREISRAEDPAGAVRCAADAPGPVTVVLSPEAVSPDLLAAVPADRAVSVFTSRDLASASVLLMRTVAHRPADDVRVAGIDGLASPGPGLEEVRELGSGESDLLAIRAHGRECGLLLRDGMICGRRRAPATLLPLAAGPEEDRPLAACLQGHGCFRNGWPDKRMLAVGSLAAKILVVDSCRALRVTGGEFGSSVSLALAALESGVLAFVGSTWLRSQDHDAGELLAARLRRGEPLAAAVAAANAALAGDPEGLGPLVVLGDGALSFAAGGDHRPAEPPRGTAGPARVAGSPAAGSGRSSTGAHEAGPDLAVSARLFATSPELRGAIEDDPHAPGLQRRLVDELLDAVEAEVYSFQEAWPRPLARTATEPGRCRTCGSGAAVVHRFATPALPGHPLVMEVCPRCTEVREGLDDALDWRWHGPDTVVRGRSFTSALVLRNESGRTRRGVMAGTVRNRLFHEARMRDVREVELPPGAETVLELTGSFPDDGPVSDYHYLKFPVCLDGRLTLLTRPVHLLTP